MSKTIAVLLMIAALLSSFPAPIHAQEQTPRATPNPPKNSDDEWLEGLAKDMRELAKDPAEIHRELLKLDKTVVWEDQEDFAKWYQQLSPTQQREFRLKLQQELQGRYPGLKIKVE